MTMLNKDCFKEINLDLDPKLLLEKMSSYQSDHSVSIRDYYKEVKDSSDTIFVHPPLDLFENDFNTGFLYDDARYVIYDDSALFKHKDRRMKCRLGIILEGAGDIEFYDNNENIIAHHDMKSWILINTQQWHAVPKCTHRISFQFGFEDDFETVERKFNDLLN